MMCGPLRSDQSDGHKFLPCYIMPGFNVTKLDGCCCCFKIEETLADPGVAWRGWLASVCVCGIPSYPTHTLPILSLHTHWTPAGFSSLLVSCLPEPRHTVAAAAILLLRMPKHLPRRVSGQNIFNGVHAAGRRQKGTKLNWDRVGIVSGQMGLRRIPMDAQ